MPLGQGSSEKFRTKEFKYIYKKQKQNGPSWDSKYSQDQSNNSLPLKFLIKFSPDLWRYLISLLVFLLSVSVIIHQVHSLFL